MATKKVKFKYIVLNTISTKRIKHHIIIYKTIIHDFNKLQLLNSQNKNNPKEDCGQIKTQILKNIS